MDNRDSMTRRTEGKTMNETLEHPIFARIRTMPEPWCSHFPKSAEEARAWKPLVRRRALASRVLVVARTRVEAAWAAYVDAVPGQNHDRELEAVLDHGDKLEENIARCLFPEFKAIPYAR